MASIKNSQCLFEARNTFNRSYGSSSFMIKGPFVTNEENGIDESNKFIIQLNHLEIIQNIFKTFGDLIKAITISFYYIDEPKANQIIECINQNATELIKFEINDCYGNVLEKLKKPFSKVYTATFSVNSYRNFNYSVVPLKFDGIFPQLQQLFIKTVNENDWKIVGEHYSQLKTLSVELPEVTENGRPDVESLFQNSPNINSLTIIYSSLKILKAASIFLPKLNYLSVDRLSNDVYEDDKIYFNNITALSIRETDENDLIPQLMVFNQLKIIILNFRFDFTDVWCLLFKNQKQNSIKILDLTADSFENRHLSSIVEFQTNIKWAFISSKTKVSADGMVNFIERSKSMVKFQVVGRLIDISQRDFLEEKLEESWNIDLNYLNYNDYIEISLQRYWSNDHINIELERIIFN